MTASRPVTPRLVAALPAVAAAAPGEWAAAMTAAGVDGLAVMAHPNDPLAHAVLTALRNASSLPLELHVPAGGTLPAPEQAPTALDVVVPVIAPEPPVAEAWAAAGVGLAWPLAGPLPSGPERVHAAAPPAETVWSAVPVTAERSVSVATATAADALPAADTLVLAGTLLGGDDPGAAVARWRGVWA